MELPASTAIVEALSLSPNPQGGWFRSFLPVEAANGAPAPRVINYLLAADTPSPSFHRRSVDSVYYFHRGCPIAVLTISPDGVKERAVLGPDLDDGQQFQSTVLAGWWRAFELLRGPWVLMSEAIAPGGCSDPSRVRGASVLQVRDAPSTGEDRTIRSAMTCSAMTEPGNPAAVVDLQARLGLEANLEGGFYRQTYESVEEVTTPMGLRPAMNSIFYLLTSRSRIGSLHRNRSDIAHFHHVGSPATYFLVSPDGEVTEVVLGSDYLAGEVPTFTAPGGCWKTSWIGVSDAIDCLISEAVVPGFCYDDHEMATLDGFAKEHPTLFDRFRPLIAHAES